MSYSNPSQWIMPLMYGDGNSIEVRINVNVKEYNLGDLVWPGKPIPSTSGVVTLDPKFPLWIGEIEVNKGLSNEDGIATCDQIQLQIQDTFAIHGVLEMGGTSDIDFDFLSPSEDANGLSLLGQIFSDSTAKYTIWLTELMPDGGRDVFFNGEISIDTINKVHGLVHKPHTPDERRTQSVRIVANCAIGDLDSFKVADLTGVITSSDMVNTGDANFFAGVQLNANLFWGNNSNRNGQRDTNINDLHTHGGVLDLQVGTGDQQRPNVIPFAYGEYEYYPSPVFPAGRNGMTFARLLQRICYVCDFYFDETADFAPDLNHVKFTLHNTADFTQGYDASVLSPYDLSFCYNTVFGISSINGLAHSTTISFDENASLKDVLKWITSQFNCYVYQAYDQVKHAIRLRVLSRDAEQSELPEDWILLNKSSEEPKLINKKSVLVTNTGAEGGVRCPMDAKKDSTEIEIKLRVKKWGNVFGSTGGGVYDFDSYMSDNSLDVCGQYVRCSTHKANSEERSAGDSEFDPLNESSFNDDGWLCGSYIYWYNSTNTNVAYPDGTGRQIRKPLKNSTWKGFYAVGAVTEKLGIYDRRTNTIYANAQKLARQLVGNRYIFNREYYAKHWIQKPEGDAGLVGRISYIFPNLSCQIRTINNIMITFRAITLKIYPLSRKVVVSQWEQVIDYSESDLSVEYISGSNNSTGSTANDGTTTGFVGGSNPSIISSGSIYSPTLGARLLIDHNITVASPPTSADSRTFINGDILFLAAQTNKKENGLYVYSSGIIARTGDVLYNGLTIQINDGKYYQGSRWSLIGAVKSSYSIGVDDINVVRGGTFKTAVGTVLDSSNVIAEYNEFALRCNDSSIAIARVGPLRGTADNGALDASSIFDLHVDWRFQPHTIVKWYSYEEDFNANPTNVVITGSASTPTSSISVIAVPVINSGLPGNPNDAHVSGGAGSTWTFTVQSTGWHNVNAMQRFLITPAVSGPISLWILQNGIPVSCLGFNSSIGVAGFANDYQFNGSDKLYFTSGDVISFGLAMKLNNPTVPTTTAALLTNYISVEIYA